MVRRRDRKTAAVTPWLAAAAIAGTAFMPAPARAQTPAPLQEWQYSAGVPLEKMMAPNIPTWQVAVGAAAAFQPRYDGADRYHFEGGPSIDIRYSDLYFASTGEGFGANVAQGQNWRISLAVAYDLGRRGQDDDEHLHGLGDINPAPELKLAADYVVSQSFPLVLRADIRRSFGGSNGWIGDVGAYLPLPGSSKTFFWFAGPSLTFADSKYMNSWFGVNDTQAANSQYSYYHASAGLKSAGFGVSAIWFFQKHWFAACDFALEQLVGSAARSPITQRSSNGVLDLSINYEF
ncbi:MipA/OmpV family protein [Paraburkholderia sp. BCC1885]|uniref:MipA/OmpV family protein n=1 Tax=Paraburkholderia sp. BCC1885 TaxID=2562669 RepID=UPI0011838D4E